MADVVVVAAAVVAVAVIAAIVVIAETAGNALLLFTYLTCIRASGHSPMRPKRKTPPADTVQISGLSGFQAIAVRLAVSEFTAR